MLAFIIDATNRAHQLAYAGDPDVGSSLLADVDAFRARYKATHVALAFDGPGAVEARRKVLPSYKVGRKPNPAIKDAVEKARAHCLLSDATVVMFAGYEADDVVFSLSRRVVEKNGRAVVCSSDGDLAQCLIKDRVSICRRWNRGGHGMTAEFVTAANWESEHGVLLSQFIEYRSLVGDSSDSIEGLPGIGPKRAAQLLVKFPTIEAIPVDALPDKTRPSWSAFLERVDAIREVMRLRYLSDDELWSDRSGSVFGHEWDAIR